MSCSATQRCVCVACVASWHRACFTEAPPCVGAQNFFDLYTLGRELGKGQFGVVQECLSKTSGQRFAVKVIAKHKMKCVPLHPRPLLRAKAQLR